MKDSSSFLFINMQRRLCNGAWLSHVFKSSLFSCYSEPGAKGLGVRVSLVLAVLILGGKEKYKLYKSIKYSLSLCWLCTGLSCLSKDCESHSGSVVPTQCCAVSDTCYSSAASWQTQAWVLVFNSRSSLTFPLLFPDAFYTEMCRRREGVLGLLLLSHVAWVDVRSVLSWPPGDPARSHNCLC